MFDKASHIQLSPDGSLLIARGWSNENGFEETFLKVSSVKNGVSEDLWMGSGKYNYPGNTAAPSDRRTTFANGRIRFFVKKKGKPRPAPTMEFKIEGAEYFYSDWIEISCDPHSMPKCKEKKIETIEDAWTPG